MKKLALTLLSTSILFVSSQSMARDFNFDGLNSFEQRLNGFLFKKSQEKRGAATYKITVTNLTKGQPFSPVAAIAYDGKQHGPAFTLGESAPVGIEHIAEYGNAADLFNSSFVTDSAQAPTDIETRLPGRTAEFELVLNNSRSTHLALAGMLGRTNDGFIGVPHFDLTQLRLNEEVTIESPSYDAGTEDNDEALETLAALGVGPARDENRTDSVDYITVHSGVISKDAGLANSQLNRNDRLPLGSAARITIERVN
ncbi:spondin domain-containing protein [Vibrio sp.]|nr:spondin domain-containing protein [Vibrio sp.]